MKTVLIIENDKDAQFLLKVILEERYKVFGVEAFENGLEIFLRGARIDAVLMSFSFEENEKGEGIKKIKEIECAKEAVCVAIVSSSRTNEGERALDKGYDGVIAKPLTEEGIYAVLEKMEEKKRGVTE